MLKIFFDKYKWIALGILFLIYSIGVWNVSGDVKENGYNKERLRNAEQIITIKTENEALLASLSRNLQDALAKQKTELTAINKETLNEIRTNPIYTTCRVTDGVRNNYKRKLATQ